MHVSKNCCSTAKNVKLDDLAIFSVGIRSKGAASVAAFNVAEYVSGLKLRARATGNLSTSTLKQDAVVKQLNEILGKRHRRRRRNLK